MITRINRLLPIVAILALAAPASAHVGEDAQTCRQECQAELAAARAATEKYKDATSAVLDGFVENGPCESSPEGSMGVHWVTLPRAIDESVTPAEPEVLLFAPDASESLGRRLVGLEYLVPVLMDGVPYYGSEQPDPARINPAPRLFGKTFDGPMAGHSPIQPWHYDLHVWAWQDNPSGLFAHLNPTVDC